MVIERLVLYRQVSLDFVLCELNCLFFHLCCLHYGIIVPFVRDLSVNANPNNITQNLHLSVRILLLHSRVNSSARFRFINRYGTFRIASSNILRGGYEGPLLLRHADQVRF